MVTCLRWDLVGKRPAFSSSRCGWRRRQPYGRKLGCAVQPDTKNFLGWIIFVGQVAQFNLTSQTHAWEKPYFGINHGVGHAPQLNLTPQTDSFNSFATMNYINGHQKKIHARVLLCQVERRNLTYADFLEWIHKGQVSPWRKELQSRHKNLSTR